jgi:ATP-binding cassette subfamily B protein
LKNLSFRYDAAKEDAKPVLDNISLSLPRGKVLGLLGRTGSGKSTLLKTLMRMVDPPEGTVFVGGADVRELDLKELRLVFGVSPLDSYLFSDTIKNNLAYGAGDGEADLASLTRASLLSALEGDMEAFARGWDTLIGERGLTLSGGQKQRVAIARAILSSPEILVLDDAFSAVDAETEKRILTGILADRHGASSGNVQSKTTIIVSHRVSTLSCAGMVAVLKDGKIDELGSPEELLAAGGFFARMAELQQLGEANG